MQDLNQLLIAKLELSTQRIQVFLIQLSLFNNDDFLIHLSEEELSRADKLKIDQKKKQFIITRGLLKLLLANILEKQTQDIVFSYAEHCKPKVDERFLNQPIEFNVSHSGDYGLIAITLKNKVGIDIEEINQESDFLSLSNRFFSEEEQKELTDIDPAEQRDAFYSAWVRKEAFTKAIGKGVAFGLDCFSVAINDNNNEITTPEYIDGQWYWYDLVAPTNYKAALTTSENSVEINISELT